jgi:16S rRNA (guanine1207-N2)-methyltransferase
MARRHSAEAFWSSLDPTAVLGGKVRSPAAVVLGSPAEVTRLAAALPGTDIVCYQMDVYQAERLRRELGENGLTARVETAPDLWDLPADFPTVFYPAPSEGERALKLDMIEQAFHVLKPRGTFVVLSSYEQEQFFPAAVKKVFGRYHTPAAGEGHVVWARREGDRPRRRHEVSFQVRVNEELSLRFVSRPGVFSYGRFDDGARALVETATVEAGERVLDIGCGCGTNGVYVARRGGSPGEVVFVDSNVRALALADLNARANGVPAFRTVASSRAEGLEEGGFDVALANPPYYAQLSIAQLFIERARALLRPGGRFYLVTKMPDQVGPLTAEVFGRTEVVSRRGYTVLCARAPA